ncbi:hypothetical protein [Amycolatopsis alkalitolerans]|uniref:Uncharacterized protein n=1 Tax=Amycolatopsis alkalitolerans TaxID=2547244 RepID=A0A5C4LS37_9PSEU|nr:hypothetical protein [Amycolatopsis alkalitolerans]TNC19060.1 hypothetical protein FG385_32865 [Amycolatopsis alkalitolerans]
MVSYAGLGSRWADAEPDSTGDNTGNWTTVLSAADLGVQVPWYEIYRGVAERVAPGTALRVRIGSHPVSAVQLGEVGEWDPAQPPLIQKGQDVEFLWDAPATGTPPRITIWLRYDDDKWGSA